MTCPPCALPPPLTATSPVDVTVPASLSFFFPQTCHSTLERQALNEVLLFPSICLRLHILWRVLTQMYVSVAVQQGLVSMLACSFVCLTIFPFTPLAFWPTLCYFSGCLAAARLSNGPAICSASCHLQEFLWLHCYWGMCGEEERSCSFFWVCGSGLCFLKGYFCPIIEMLSMLLAALANLHGCHAANCGRTEWNEASKNSKWLDAFFINFWVSHNWERSSVDGCFITDWFLFFIYFSNIIWLSSLICRSSPLVCDALQAIQHL